MLGVDLLFLLRLLHLFGGENCPPVFTICLLLSISSTPLLSLSDDSPFIHGMDKYSITVLSTAPALIACTSRWCWGPELQMISMSLVLAPYE